MTPDRTRFSAATEDYMLIAAEYRNSVIRCQQAIDQLRASKRELRRIAGGGDMGPIPDVQLDCQIAELSKRELQVFAIIGQGLPTHQVAERLGIKLSTVETYRERLKWKLQVESGAALIRLAVLWCAEPAASNLRECSPAPA